MYRWWHDSVPAHRKKVKLVAHSQEREYSYNEKGPPTTLHYGPEFRGKTVGVTIDSAIEARI